MPDAIFDDARLAALYDPFDPNRSDLDAYESIATDLGAGRVLDLGCGTGTLAIRLAARGLEVTGIDPAGASVDVARSKPGAGTVRWVVGTAADAPTGWADLALMTANVAQVFLDDAEWADTLRHLRRALAPGGHLVFETRRPAARAWETWAEHYAPTTIDVPGIGSVTEVYELSTVALPLVSFRFTYTFHADGTVAISDSTLRFRERAEVEADLAEAGFEVRDVREAPDRPGREYVFVARRRGWTLRAATPEDEEHLWSALGQAAGWRGKPIPFSELRADPALAHYVTGHLRDDEAMIAVDDEGRVLGAAWLRTWSCGEHGYGYVADDVAELAMGVEPSSRGAGLGAALLTAVLDHARRAGRRAVSLSVERANTVALRLYERAGFEEVGVSDGALTLLLDLTAGGAPDVHDVEAPRTMEA